MPDICAKFMERFRNYSEAYAENKRIFRSLLRWEMTNDIFFKSFGTIWISLGAYFLSHLSYRASNFFLLPAYKLQTSWPNFSIQCELKLLPFSNWARLNSSFAQNESLQKQPIFIFFIFISSPLFLLDPQTSFDQMKSRPCEFNETK